MQGVAVEAWECAEVDAAVVEALAKGLGVDALVARVLAVRGVRDVEPARSFLAPKLADLTRPEGMADRAAAADRLARAIRANERVALFGDYDVDGLTSAALLATALRAMGGEVVPISASRFDGGYGFSQTGLTRVRESGATLLVTCDCGTSDHDRLAQLRADGIDAIVVDHHKVPADPLPALAFLNPHRPDCSFPFKGLASVGLALSLAAAVRAELGATLDLRTLLDLVAVGTIADVMPLEGDNRILTRVGLERLTLGQGRPGLRALAREARVSGRVRAHDVGFSIAPMLNAPGRLGSPAATLNLLLCNDDVSATTLARELSAANERRRRVSSDLLSAAIAQVTDVYGNDLPAGLVVGGDGWHPGVGGIVAGRLAERFDRPVIVLAFDGADGAGSARAPKGFPLFDAVRACAAEFVQFGGHDDAAGMRVERGRFDSARAAFALACGALEREGRGSSPAWADAELLESDLTTTLARQLDALEPTGQAHPEPRVVVRNIRWVELRPVGADRAHLRARIGLGRRTITGFVRDGAQRRARGEFGRMEGRADVIASLRTDPFAGPDAVQLDVIAVRDA